ETIREITLRASAREKAYGNSHPVAATISSAMAVPANDDRALIAELTKQLAVDLRPEITAVIRREADETKEWFLNHAVPKATRVAQRETFDLLRSHGVISKKKNDSGNVGRNTETSGQGREGKCDQNEIALFLAETITAIRQSAANAMAAGRLSLHDACLAAGRELGELLDQFVASEQIATDKTESSLTRIEEVLAKAVWDSTNGAERETMLNAARFELQSYALRMERDIFEDAVRRRVVTGLREQYGIPRISLFYF